MGGLDVQALIALALVWGVGIATSVALTGFATLGGLGDVPDCRSSHSRTTPTAGGLGIFGGAMAALVVATPYLGAAPGMAAVAALGLGAACLGLADDMLGLRARVKFSGLLVLSVAAVWTLGPVRELPTALWGDAALPLWVGWLGTLFWFGVAVNAVNFMDGINGLLAATLNAAAVGYAAVALVSGQMQGLWLALALSAGLVGFMPYNFRRRARVFAGDTGALPAGFLFACLPLLGGAGGAAGQLVLLAPLLIVPLLADVILTVILRARRGEPLGHAHRSHLYQRLADRIGHTRTTWLYTAGVAVMIGFALVALRGSGLTVEAVAVTGIGTALVMALVRRAQERRATT